MLTKVGAGVEGRDGGDGLRKSEDNATVDEAGHIGNEDLLGDIPPCVSERVENTASLEPNMLTVTLFSIPYQLTR